MVSIALATRIRPRIAPGTWVLEVQYLDKTHNSRAIMLVLLANV